MSPASPILPKGAWPSGKVWALWYFYYGLVLEQGLSKAWLSVCSLSNYIIDCDSALKLLIKLEIKNFPKSVGLSAFIKACRCSNCSWYSRIVLVCASLLNSSIESFLEAPLNWCRVLPWKNPTQTCHFFPTILDMIHPSLHRGREMPLPPFCSSSIPCTRKCRIFDSGSGILLLRTAEFQFLAGKQEFGLARLCVDDIFSSGLQ